MWIISAKVLGKIRLIGESFNRIINFPRKPEGCSKADAEIYRHNHQLKEPSISTTKALNEYLLLCSIRTYSTQHLKRSPTPPIKSQPVASRTARIWLLRKPSESPLEVNSLNDRDDQLGSVKQSPFLLRLLFFLSRFKDHSSCWYSQEKTIYELESITRTGEKNESEATNQINCHSHSS